MIKIICACKNLVEVVDRKIVNHDDPSGEQCRASGMRYVSRKIGSGLPGAPRIEVVAEREGTCKSCGEPVTEFLAKISGPDPRMN
jgi:hypothetical protein